MLINYKKAKKRYKEEDTKLNILDDLICEELTKLGYKVEKAYEYETEKKRIQLGLENEPHIDSRACSDAKGVSAKPKINARIIANGKMKRSKHDTQVYYMKEI